MNWGEISSTFHYWYYLDLLLDHRFIHIRNSVVLKMAGSLQDRPEFYNSTRGAKGNPTQFAGPSVAEIVVNKTSLARMKEVAAQGQDAPSSID